MCQGFFNFSVSKYLITFRCEKTILMNFIESLLTCYKKIFNYSGRASKSEFWWFQLLNLAILAFAILYTNSDYYDPLGSGTIFFLDKLMEYSIYLFIVNQIALYAAAVRRFHDMDKSGFMVLWSLIPIAGGLIVLIALLGDGTEGINKFGPKPKK